MQIVTKFKKDKSNACSKALKIILLIHFTFLIDVSVFAQIIPDPVSPEHYYNNLIERPEWTGFWINVFNKTPDLTGYLDVMAGETDKPQWRGMEPSDGVYDFALLKERLRRAVEMDTYYYCEMWLGGTRSPSWMLESNGGPVAEAFSNEGRGPYFLDPDYLKFSERFFKRLASEIASYDTSLINRFAFIQPGFGSTGDRQLYKGAVTPPEYNLSKSEYVYFMQTQVKAFTSAFRSHEKTKNIRFLWNISNYEGSDPNAGEEELFGSWMKAHYNCQLRKQQFTTAIGYMTPDEMDQDRELRDDFFGNGNRWGGNPEFVRGEFNDAKWNNTPMAQIDKQLNYYWTGISSVDRGIDAWEGKYTEMKPEYKEAYAFSHKYSYYKKAESSPVAFIALRDVLDYSDGDRFPASEYGAVNRNNTARINNILSEYSSYGARNDDSYAVINMSQSDYLLNSTGYNDCVWNVIARNYRRFITQIEPNETSVGYWRVNIGTDKQPYGRFARGFDVEKGKNTMYFDVDDQFFLGNRMEEKNNLKVKIIYYAEEKDSWELQYHASDSTMKTALEVTNEVGQGWLSKEVLIEDALLNNGGPKGADLVLQNTGNTNCKFHLIELERDVVKVKYDSVKVEGVSINSCSLEELFENETRQLNAAIIPDYAGDQTVFWSSSDTLVATVDSSGLVTAISEGSANITVTTNDGGYIDECEVKVSKPVISVSGITIGDCPFGIQQAGDTFQLTAAVSPGNATDKSVTWSSSNSSVTSVDTNGFVTTHSMGNAYIRVTANDIGFYDECLVLVDDSGTTNATLTEGQNANIKVYPNPVSDKLYFILPETTFNKTIKIFSSEGKLLYAENTINKQLEIDAKQFKSEEILLVQIHTDQKCTSFKLFVTI